MTPIATLIAVYAGDDAKQVREALDSVLGQQIDPQFESRIYLGVDGPVPSEIEKVVVEYSPALYRVVRMPRNMGLARALNALIRQLGDEVLVFRMDADDVALKTRYQAQIDHMASHAEIDILGTAILEFGDGIEHERIVRFATGPEDALATAHRRVPVAHPSVCMRRNVLDRTGGYPERGTNEDVALWFLCMKHGFRFDNLPDAYLRFRIGRGFWRRRSFQKAWVEFLTYMRGIYQLHGLVSLRYAYPLVRLLVRVAPTGISRALYRSRVLRRQA